MTRGARREGPEVVVVGGGLSGAFAARLLRSAGRRVLLLEGGPRRAEPLEAEAASELVGPDDARWAWRCEGMRVEWLRVRALGGRSRVWGGNFEALPASTFRHAADVGCVWPLPYDVMRRLHRRVIDELSSAGAALRRDGRGHGALEAISRGLGVRVRPRNVLARGQRPLSALDLLEGVALRTDASAARLSIDRGGRVRGVVTSSRDGGEQLVAAPAVLLAASPVETARILLETARVERFALHPSIGRGLVDHLVAGRLVLSGVAAPGYAPGVAALVPRFVNLGGRRRRDYPGGFSVEVTGPTPLDALPEEVRARLPSVGRSVEGGVAWTLYAIGETFTREGREVVLDLAQRDGFGRPCPLLRCGLHDEERRMLDDMDETVDVMASMLGGADAEVIATGNPRENFMMGHEAGTCAMGATLEHPVDLEGRVRGLLGVRVVDGSLMPTATDRHPTATLLALTLWVVECLLKEWRRV